MSCHSLNSYMQALLTPMPI